jgi:hypothetical protein
MRRLLVIILPILVLILFCRSSCPQEEKEVRREEKLTKLAVRLDRPPSKSKLSPELLTAKLIGAAFLGYTSEEDVIVAVRADQVESIKNRPGIKVAPAPSDFTRIKTLILIHREKEKPDEHELEGHGLKIVGSNEAGHYVVVESTRPEGFSRDILSSTFALFSSCASAAALTKTEPLWWN